MNTMVPIARRCTGRLGRARARHGLLLLAGVALSGLAVSADAQESQRGAVEHFFGTLIRQTATACPLTSPAAQAAHQVTFWIDPTKIRIVMMQLSAQGKPDPRLTSAPHTQPAFDGKWMWTDAQGQTQPRPTLFVGLMSRNNPYLGQLEGTFRDLAGELRKGSCHECHTPDNYAGMKRLILMQTPVHAAGEIKRMMRAVRQDKMPLDDAGLYKELDPTVKAALLKYGAAFESLVDAAREWEA